MKKNELVWKIAEFLVARSVYHGKKRKERNWMEWENMPEDRKQIVLAVSKDLINMYQLDKK